MKIKILVLLCLMSVCNAAFAAGNKYSICTVGGYYSGAENKFLSGLAMYMASKNDLLLDPVCTSSWESAVEVGERLTKTGKVKNQFDEIVINQASRFSDQVYGKLSSGISFDK